ncbi:MAG: thiolase family protein [Cyanobacteria bacterium NC_groundwater_1444_Ag_S-0.65um_54_12]|nr:thiolase family protein [Cyanobacteria bacterium NC_groundwater_1444_Ag_S-0.65um_54_12]
MKDVFLIDGIRTPFGNLGGAFKDLTAQELGKIVVGNLLARTAVPPAQIAEVLFGCCVQGSDAPNIARVISLLAGLPHEVCGYTVHRNCGSGLQALVAAYQAIQSGDGDLFLVGGTDSMSSAPYVNRDLRFGKRLRHSALIDSLWEGLTDPNCGQIMGRTAENLAAEFGISREEQDKFAVESHKRAFRAMREGKFKDEIMPVAVPKRGPAGNPLPPETVASDEGPAAALTTQMLANYPTIFKENGTVTPGNSCGISDGAVALLVASAKKVEELGLRPLSRLVAYAVHGVAPERMGIAPAHAIPKALKRAGLTLDQLDLLEINEAFAAQCLAVERQLGNDRAKTNVNGGAIAIGHPVGASGARLALTLSRELARRNGRYGVASLCIGGGQGIAMIFERTA